MSVRWYVLVRDNGEAIGVAAGRVLFQHEEPVVEAVWESGSGKYYSGAVALSEETRCFGTGLEFITQAEYETYHTLMGLPNLPVEPGEVTHRHNCDHRWFKVRIPCAKFLWQQ